MWETVARDLLSGGADLSLAAALILIPIWWGKFSYKSLNSLLAILLLADGLTHLLEHAAPCGSFTSFGGILRALNMSLAAVSAMIVLPLINKISRAEKKLEADRSIAAIRSGRLEELAMQDSLTGIPNRRHFDAFLVNACRRGEGAKPSVAAIMIDADLFTLLNDTQGHLAGDECLRALASVISSQLRQPESLAARVGGDEFAVILPGAGEVEATSIADDILQAVRRARILDPANVDGCLTVSIGVAAFVPSDRDGKPDDLLQQADTALYVAKQRGGNQVCCAGQTSGQEGEAPCHSDFSYEPLAGSSLAGRSKPRMPTGIDFIGILHGLPFGVFVTDSTQPSNPIVFANASFTRITGYSLADIVGQNLRFLQGPETDPQSVADIANAIRCGKPVQRELLNYRKDGRPFWNDLTMQPLMDTQGGVMGYLGLHSDQTDRRRREEAQRQMEVRLAGVVDNLPGYLFQRVLTPAGALVYSYFSQTYWRLLGIDQVPPIAEIDVYAHIYVADLEAVKIAVANSVAALSPCTIEFRAVRADGTLLWLRTQSTPRAMAGGNVVWTGVGIDISVEMASKEALAYLAYHDPLTGLCNRVLFIKTLNEMCALNPKNPCLISVFVLDIDCFQGINEQFGPVIGDAALRSVADRLSEFAGVSGVATRLGGDEFGVATVCTPEENGTGKLAAALLLSLRRPIQLNEISISLQVSIGVSNYPFQDGEPVFAEQAGEALVKQSNFALAEAKRVGGGIFKLYAKGHDQRERNRAMLRQSMRRGLDEQQFVLHYHPTVDLTTGEITGAEALVRWDHPALGMQRPDLFIPEAERSGLIVPLGAWVMKAALREVQEWKKQSPRRLRVAINVSPIQLLDPMFMLMLDAALAETGADPTAVDLELTESALIDSSALSVLHGLKERGCRLAVDDFGTGYSSFQYLRTLPVSAVKIDQAFVRHMVIESSDASIVRAITTVAKSLKLEVIAEGIETSVQRDFLRNEGCQIGQGYLFSLPLTSEDFRWLLKNDAKLPLEDGYGLAAGERAPGLKTPPLSFGAAGKLAKRAT